MLRKLFDNAQSPWVKDAILVGVIVQYPDHNEITDAESFFNHFTIGEDRIIEWEDGVNIALKA